MSAHAWNDLPATLEASLPKVTSAAKEDKEMKAFVNSAAILVAATLGIKSAGSDNTVLITVTNGNVKYHSGSSKDAEFVISARPEQWEQFFKQTPVAPYQSWWGMFGMNIKLEGIDVIGDQIAWARWAHVWRRSLELLHDTYAGKTPEDPQEEQDDDVITGHYVVLKDIPLWGRSKVYYETSGNGPVQIVFLHTAGSDGRQYNGVLNDKRMLERCTMYALDLPAHGKSFPYETYSPGNHTNTEESYVGCITAFIKRLGLKKPIVCGASMAGQVSLACAIHAENVGCGGTIPLQGSDYLNMDRAWGDQSPFVNQALWNPEWIYGMMSPTAPLVNRQLIWHLYSAQAYGIFHGDLDFYFGGWDGRSRMADIDTKKCPVYMLTGEYDWSNTPEMSQATADKIKGSMHSPMKGIGHFPATENPARFVDYVLMAIDHIVKTRED